MLGFLLCFVPGLNVFDKWSDAAKEIDWGGLMLIAGGLCAGTLLSNTGAARYDTVTAAIPITVMIMPTLAKSLIEKYPEEYGITYPGSFDPFTNGHKEILGRTCKIFDMVIVAIAADDDKQSLFTLQERQYLIERATADLPHQYFFVSICKRIKTPWINC